jgi:single-strand DNA-binding protein
MKAFGLARIGRDAEVRHTSNGDSVCGLSLAFDRRVKGEKVTDWVDASLWGKRAEALQPFLKKGGLVAVTLDEIHIEVYQSNNGQGHKLAARVIDIELAGGGQAAPSQQSQPYDREAARNRQAAVSRGEAVEDQDIPF